MTATRRLAAILAADVAGYSRLMGADEGGTLQALKAIRAELIDPTIAAHNGRLVKTTGDGLLVEFGSAPFQSMANVLSVSSMWIGSLSPSRASRAASRSAGSSNQASPVSVENRVS